MTSEKPDLQPAIRTISMPADTNSAGDIFGVWLMARMDLSADNKAAQVVGAGFSVSEETGNVATLVKLLRVVTLAPVVVVANLLIRSLADEGAVEGKKPPLVPTFAVGFVVLAALRSAGFLPEPVIQIAFEASRWLLLTAIAAVGLKTLPKDILNVEFPAVALLIAEIDFLAMLVGVSLSILDHSATN